MHWFAQILLQSPPRQALLQLEQATKAFSSTKSAATPLPSKAFSYKNNARHLF
jgi:hypothetical protein